jgi:hypothetical protein
LTRAERPVLPLYEDEIDHDIIRADTELGLELVGDKSIEGKFRRRAVLGLIILPDATAITTRVTRT